MRVLLAPFIILIKVQINLVYVPFQCVNSINFIADPYKYFYCDNIFQIDCVLDINSFLSYLGYAAR